jgi:ferredoxin--NADP+ reductase
MSIHKVIDTFRFGLNQSTLYLKIERNDLEFEPGSCVSIFNRTYSIASGADEPNFLEFLIKIVPNGDASKQFALLNPVDTVEITDVFSYFTPGKDQTDSNYTYFATGTGIAPFRSALLTYNHAPHSLFWGGKLLCECYDVIDLKHINLKLAHSLYQPAYLPSRITEYLEQVKISQDHTYYLCGLDVMIDEVSNHLINNDVSYTQIQTEQFFQKTC